MSTQDMLLAIAVHLKERPNNKQKIKYDKLEHRLVVKKEDSSSIFYETRNLYVALGLDNGEL